MSVFVPTGAAVAVDPLDVLLVAPNGTTSTTLYLAQGQPVVIGALPAAVVAELDTAAGLTAPDTLFTTPVTASEWPSPIYIAGSQVKRVQSSGATQLGSMVLFALSGFMVTVPAVDLSDMVDLINATSSGGGGGGNPTAAGTSEINFDYLDNIAAPEDVYTSWTFVGEDGSDTVGVVILTIEFRNALPLAPGFAQLGATGAALPYPPDTSTVYGTVGGFDAADNESAIISSGDIYISCDADSGASNVSGAVTFQYTTGAS